MRIGHGFDAHGFAEERILVIGGVTIPHPKGLAGHSDADVLLHAICDALLGAAAMGDIGGMYPDTDAAHSGADSRCLLRGVVERVRDAGYVVGNIDATVVAQAPKLSPYIGEMREHIAADCRLPRDHVNVKATTTEKMGYTGRQEGIAAHAVALILPAK